MQVYLHKRGFFFIPFFSGENSRFDQLSEGLLSFFPTKCVRSKFSHVSALFLFDSKGRCITVNK